MILAALVGGVAVGAGAQSRAVQHAAVSPDTLRRSSAEPAGGLGADARTLTFITDEGTWMSVDVAPDGRTLVFDLLGDLYTLPIGGGRATRITAGPAFDAQPRFAPDGRSLVFVSDRGGAAALWIAEADGRHPREFVRGPHLSPAWSPDGRCIAASRRTPPSDRGDDSNNHWDVMLYCGAAARGLKLGTGIGATFSPDGRQVYFRPAGEPYGWGRDSLTVYNRRDGRTSAHPGGARPLINPDGRRLVFAVPYEGRGALKVQTIATGDERWVALGLPPLNVADPSRDALPGYAFTRDGRALITWRGGKLWRIDLARGTRTPVPFSAEVRLPVGERVPVDGALVGGARDLARGTLLLRGARLVTMRGHEVIERGDLVVADGRIATVGERLPVPPGAHVVDVAGTTILPGYIDLWATGEGRPGAHAPPPAWAALAQLAYGVTTVREPGAASPEAVDTADWAEAGDRLGPRYLAAGAMCSVALDWTVPVTRAQERCAVYTGTFPITPMGRDVVHLIARSGMTYVPGLVLNDLGPRPMDRFIAEGGYHDDPKLQRFIPHVVLDQETLRRDWTRPQEDLTSSYAADAVRIVAAGGRVAVGTRGAFPGLGVHWELWTLQCGGMAAHDVLRAGTIAGAEALGVAQDVGSLEVGKLADLQVVEGNPLADLRLTTALRYVMQGGRLYDAATLAEVWPRPRVRPAPWWLEHDPARPLARPRPLPPLSRH